MESRSSREGLDPPTHSPSRDDHLAVLTLTTRFIGQHGGSSVSICRTNVVEI